MRERDLAGRARAIEAIVLGRLRALACGTGGNVIRLLPPLVIDEPLLHDALDVLETALRGVR